MLLKLLAQIVFYALMGFLAVYSLTMVYVLLQFGKSKILGLIISAFYVIVMMSLYAAALNSFNQIPFLET